MNINFISMILAILTGKKKEKNDWKGIIFCKCNDALWKCRYHFFLKMESFFYINW